MQTSEISTLSDFRSYHLVYVDESGCDKRIGFRRTGWSPIGVAPPPHRCRSPVSTGIVGIRFYRLIRGKKFPPDTQDGILLSRVFQGTTDSALFEDFIEQLFHWPEPNSVLMKGAKLFSGLCPLWIAVS